MNDSSAMDLVERRSRFACPAERTPPRHLAPRIDDAREVLATKQLHRDERQRLAVNRQETRRVDRDERRVPQRCDDARLLRPVRRDAAHQQFQCNFAQRLAVGQELFRAPHVTEATSS